MRPESSTFILKTDTILPPEDLDTHWPDGNYPQTVEVDAVFVCHDDPDVETSVTVVGPRFWTQDRAHRLSPAAEADARTAIRDELDRERSRILP